MTPIIREWTCAYASATKAGDYFQVLFEEFEENDSPYVLIQSQYEFPEPCDVTVETDNGEWCAELLVESAALDGQRLVIDGSADDGPVRIIVNYTADDVTKADLKRVLKIMLPDIVVAPWTP